MPRLFPRLRRSRTYRGSTLLLSSGERLLRVVFAVLFLWGLTAWAMEWL